MKQCVFDSAKQVRAGASRSNFTRKRRALSADRAAKLEALSARFVLRIELVPIALRLLEVPSGFVALTLRRRKATRHLELEYDAATRQLVAPRCDGCQGSAARPAVCDDALHLLCETCAPRSEGRVACAACGPGSKRPAHSLVQSSQPADLAVRTSNLAEISVR